MAEKNFSTKVLARLTHDQKFRLDQAASRTGVSTQRMIRYLIQRGLDNLAVALRDDQDGTLLSIHMMDQTLTLQSTSNSPPRTKAEVDEAASAAERRMEEGAKRLQEEDNSDE